MMEDIGTHALKSRRLLLRRFMMSDDDQMFKNWCYDARVTTYLTWEPHENKRVTQSILRSWVDDYAKPFTYRWAIVNIKDNCVIGSIDCVDVDQLNESASIGYCLSYDYWNQGIMSEALKLVIQFLFERVGFHRIEARHVSDNVSSGKVMEKAGMIKEGVFRKSERKQDGPFMDMVYYAILKEDYIEKIDRR